MAMTPEKWSVNGLSVELRRDRRTVAQRLGGVAPAGQGPHGPLYLMADVVSALHPPGRGARASKEADFDSGFDAGATRHAEVLLADAEGNLREDEPFLTEALAACLARSRTAEACLGILHAWLAEAAWQAILASATTDAPDPPEWSKLPPELLVSALEAMVWGGADCDEVLELVQGVEKAG